MATPDKSIDPRLFESAKKEFLEKGFEPVGKEREDIESLIIRIIEESSEEAHGRTHDRDGRTDNGCLKNERVCCFHIEYLAGDLE